MAIFGSPVTPVAIWITIEVRLLIRQIVQSGPVHASMIRTCLTTTMHAGKPGFTRLIRHSSPSSSGRREVRQIVSLRLIGKPRWMQHFRDFRCPRYQGAESSRRTPRRATVWRFASAHTAFALLTCWMDGMKSIRHLPHDRSNAADRIRSASCDRESRWWREQTHSCDDAS